MLMMRAACLAALATQLAFSSAWDHEVSGSVDPSTTYNFLAIGDWGEDDVTQLAAAAGMGVVAAEIGAKQVVALGDNFYHDEHSNCTTAGGHYGGICLNNTDGVDGVHRFRSTFESVYTAESLRTIPWYAIAGNVSAAPPSMRPASPAWVGRRARSLVRPARPAVRSFARLPCAIGRARCHC